MKQEFFSNHAINDEVEFIPMFNDQREMGISDESIEGKILSVEFTESKVFYHIYSHEWGKIFNRVSSHNVIALEKAQLF
ncbi:MAG TPA: hypothetical protein VMI12_11150 [Puia sp.]|nr:hypothetical protein [Puia sp.]